MDLTLGCGNETPSQWMFLLMSWVSWMYSLDCSASVTFSHLVNICSRNTGIIICLCIYLQKHEHFKVCLIILNAQQNAWHMSKVMFVKEAENLHIYKYELDIWLIDELNKGQKMKLPLVSQPRRSQIYEEDTVTNELNVWLLKPDYPCLNHSSSSNKLRDLGNTSYIRFILLTYKMEITIASISQSCCKD